MTREYGPEDGPVTVATGDDGRTLANTDGFARIPSLVSVGLDNSIRTDDLEQPTSVASFSPSGELILFDSARQQGHVDVGSIADDRVLPRGLPADIHPDGAFVDPLGWLDDETAVVLAHADVTVAVDLLDRPTADRPAPDWPWSPSRERGLVGLTLLAGPLALGGAAAWRQRLP